jgi:hypothetical protein
MLVVLSPFPQPYRNPGLHTVIRRESIVVDISIRAGFYQ